MTLPGLRCDPQRQFIEGEAAMIRSVLVVLGVIFLVIACVYWLVPAGSLPTFVPGYEAGSAHVHIKHGVASLVVAAVCFIVAWFVGRSQLGRL